MVKYFNCDINNYRTKGIQTFNQTSSTCIRTAMNVDKYVYIIFTNMAIISNIKRMPLL